MKVLIAGGGTGGHLFPGIALAEEIVTRGPNNDVLFVGTERGLEARVVPQCGYKLELIRVSALKGMGFKRLLAGLASLPGAALRSIGILRRFRPDVVVGVGGYASGPVVLAAWLLRIPTAVQEQNALPGLTNRLLGKIASVVFTAFPEAEQRFPRRKVQLLGNPIRRAILDNFLKSSVPHDRFKLLVFGGSQGAHVLNQTMVQAAAHLTDLADRLHILHQTGARELEFVRAGYAKTGLSAEVVEFIQDMSGAYARADAVVCRAGATTLAELTVAKKAAVLVPFARAADNHQEKNARALSERGAASTVLESELSPERLAAEVRALVTDPGLRGRMERAAGALGRPEAAREIADVLVELAARRWGGRP